MSACFLNVRQGDLADIGQVVIHCRSSHRRRQVHDLPGGITLPGCCGLHLGSDSRSRGPRFRAPSTSRDLTAGYVSGLENIARFQRPPVSWHHPFDNISGRFVAKYDVSDDMNVYASAPQATAQVALMVVFLTTRCTGDAFSEETIASMEPA